MFKKCAAILGILAIFSGDAYADICHVPIPGQYFNPSCPASTYTVECVRPGSSGCNTTGGTGFACGGRAYTVEPAVPRVWIDVGRLKNTSTQIRRNYIVAPGQEFTVRYAPPTGAPVNGFSVSKFRSDVVINNQICSFQSLERTCPPEGCVLGRYSIGTRKGRLLIQLTAKRPHSKAPVNMIGDVILNVIARGNPPADVPFITFESPEAVRVGQTFSVTARTSGDGITRVVSNGWTGPVDPVEYLNPGGEVGFPVMTWGGVLHGTAEGNITVSMTAFNSAGRSQTYSHTIRVRDYYTYANCDINGPSTVSVGQPFNISWTNLKSANRTSSIRVSSVSPTLSNWIQPGNLSGSSGSWNGVSISQPGRTGLVIEATSNYGYKGVCSYYVDAY